MFILEILAMLMPLLQPAPQVELAVQASQVTNAAAMSAATETIDWQINRPVDSWRIALREELADDAGYAARVEAAIDNAVELTGADPAMLWSVAYTESHGRHESSPGNVKRGGSGEVGMMQVMPFWSRSLEKKYGFELDLFKLEDNVIAGAIVLSRGGESPQHMLSYYNTGQRIRSSAYQRKVMRYWSGLTEIPDSIEYKDEILLVSAQAW
ncbi:MAG: transglycosylase SLT domain-containing protein [Planctomycetales bacterium]|nr:transglycosylase SLT domain-containing protein [bacterium]UNM08395.1 MAG: transglycosylase SLT domain-containing protein [Planctomycetales bacterium]